MRSRAIRRAAPLLLALVAALLVAVPATGQDGEGAESPLERIGGDDAIQTAALLSADTYESSQYVIIARADAYADALAGSLLAGALNAPILYVMPDVLPQATIDEIQRLGAERVVILGGTHAVSQAVEDELVALGLQVGRYGGENRYETALAIAEAGLMGQAPSAVFFVEGEHADPARGWPDAINVAALAAHTGTPVIPVNAEFVPPVIAEAWAEWADATGTIIGGTTAVTQEVEDELAGSEEAPRTLTRLAGDTRFTTSQAVYAYGVSEAEMDPSVRYAIPGGSFALGLAAGAVAGAQGHPIVMVDSVAPENSPATIDLLGQARDMLDRVVLVGSTDALSQEVEDAIAEAISPPDVEAAFCLTLLHHNDGESQLLGAPVSDLYGGLARMVTLANAEQAADTPEGCESGGTVTVTSGDNFLAGAVLNASDPGDPDLDSPVYDGIGLTHMNYDALDIGNHDFDFGPAFLARFINSIQGDNPPPFLSANLDVSAEPALAPVAARVLPSITVVKDGVEVGIIGLTTPALRSISSPGPNVDIDHNIVQVVQDEVDAMSAAGVEHIVLISHLQGLSEDVDLVSQISGVDAVVAGGGDEVLADPGDPLVPGDLEVRHDTYPLELPDADGNVVPTVTTAGDYKYLGRLTLYFGPDGELLVDTPYDDGTSRMLRVADETLPGGVEDDPRVVDEVYGPVQEYIEALAEQEIATSEVALEGRRPQIRQQETNLGNLVADAHVRTVATRAADYGLPTDQPIVGLQNGGGIRNNTLIPPGPITELNTYEILAFSNIIAAVPDFTIERLLPVLERAYSDVENAAGQFAHVSNLIVEVDLSQQAQVLVPETGAIKTPGERVRNVWLIDGEDQIPLVVDGEIVDNAPEFMVASIDFSLQNGDNYPFNLEEDEMVIVGVSYQQSLSDYLKAPEADGGLEGVISAADYPEGGEGRITITGAPAGGE